MSILHAQAVENPDVRPLEPARPTARTRALLQSQDAEVNRLRVPSDQENPPHQDRGEIVVQCLEGQVAITDSAQTQNLHAGELLHLPAGEPHSVKGTEHASLLLSVLPPHNESEGETSFDQDSGPNVSEENEMIYARGSLLSVMQAVVLVISLALLFVAVASNIFAGVLVVGAVLVIFGCLHYWVWGRWMSPPIAQPRVPPPSLRR